MKIEEFRSAQRNPEEWTPFMRTLEYRMTRRRRHLRMAIAAAAVLAFVLAGTFWRFSRGPESRTLLRANVPTRSAPAFTPRRGSALATAHGIVVINPEDRT